MRAVGVLWVLILTLGCSSNKEQLYFKSLSDGWDQSEPVSFAFKNTNESEVVDLFLYIRNNEEYPFANIHLIAELEDPIGTITTDTLSYRLAKPDGRWLGKGLLSKESKLWYKEAISLPYVGNYTVRVRSAMRYNENVNPIEVLPGIKAVGIGIEK